MLNSFLSYQGIRVTEREGWGKSTHTLWICRCVCYSLPFTSALTVSGENVCQPLHAWLTLLKYSQKQQDESCTASKEKQHHETANVIWLLYWIIPHSTCDILFKGHQIITPPPTVSLSLFHAQRWWRHRLQCLSWYALPQEQGQGRETGAGGQRQ